MPSRDYIIAGGGYAGLLVSRGLLEASPVTHMLILLPGLAIVGGVFAHASKLPRFHLAEPFANALTLFAVFVILFWMLPRYVDASLVSWKVELLKFTTIPLFVGGAIAVSWGNTNPLLRGFLKANAISMLGILAFIYYFAPVRICNSYLVSAQKDLGLGFLWAAGALTLLWSFPLFFAPPERDRKNHADRMGTTITDLSGKVSGAG